MDDIFEEEEEEQLELDNPSISTEELESIVHSGVVKNLETVFETIPDIDIAEAANGLEIIDLIYIFRKLKPTETANFFDELDQDVKENLIRKLTDKELVQIINEQEPDDLSDTVTEMPANLAQKVLKLADKDMRSDLNKLLAYKEDTAGALMTTEYLEFRDDVTVEDTIDAIRERGKDAETIYTIFVKDKKREFVGTVDLDDLIFAKKSQQLSEIMNKDVLYVLTSTDQEEVGKMFRRYDLNALAVLNADNRLVGIITIDDAVDVMTEESTEDISLMSGVIPTDKSYMELTPWENAKKCIPWIMVLLVLGTFSSMVLSKFEDKLSKMAILAAFIPTLMDTGGNSGGQTTGLMIRSLALNEFGPKDFWKILWKEIRSAILVALCVAAFAFVWFTIEQYLGIVSNSLTESLGDIAPSVWNGECWNLDFFGNVAKVSGLVAGTMFVSVIFAKSIGTALPLAAAAIKKDPALLSQPMLTTIMDIVTLLVYFGVAMLFFPIIA